MALLALVALAAAAVFAAPVVRAQEDTGTITIRKVICDSVERDTNCVESRDTRLDGYNIDFEVRRGPNPNGALVQTITVTINENAQGQGDPGNGSQGQAQGEEIRVGTYTVCDTAVAYRDGDEVLLDPEPRPDETTGGARQTENGDCITVDLVPGNNVLNFINAIREGEQPGGGEQPDTAVLEDPTTLVKHPLFIALAVLMLGAAGGLVFYEWLPRRARRRR